MDYQRIISLTIKFFNKLIILLLFFIPHHGFASPLCKSSQRNVNSACDQYQELLAESEGIINGGLNKLSTINNMTASCFNALKNCVKACGQPSLNSQFNTSSLDHFIGSLESSEMTVSNEVKQCIEKAKTFANLSVNKVGGDQMGACSKMPDLRKGANQSEATFHRRCQSLKKFTLSNIKVADNSQDTSARTDDNRIRTASTKMTLPVAKPGTECPGNEILVAGKCVEIPICTNGVQPDAFGGLICVETGDPSTQCPGDLLYIQGKCQSVEACTNVQVDINGKKFCADPIIPPGTSEDQQKKCDRLNAAKPGSHEMKNGRCVPTSTSSPVDDEQRKCDGLNAAKPDSHEIKDGKCVPKSGGNAPTPAENPPKPPKKEKPTDDEKDKEIKDLKKALDKASSNMGGGGSGSGSGGFGGGGSFDSNFDGGDGSGGNDRVRAAGFNGKAFEPEPVDTSGAGEAARPTIALPRFTAPRLGLRPPKKKNRNGDTAPRNSNPAGRSPGISGKKAKAARLKPKRKRGRSSLWGLVKKMTGGFFGGDPAAPPTNKSKAAQNAKTTQTKTVTYQDNQGRDIKVNGLSREELAHLNDSFRRNIPQQESSDDGAITEAGFIMSLYEEHRDQMLNRYGCEPPLKSCDSSKKQPPYKKNSKKMNSRRNKK